MRWLYTGPSIDNTREQWIKHVHSVHPDDSFITSPCELRKCDVWLAEGDINLQFSILIQIPYHSWNRRVCKSETKTTNNGDTNIEILSSGLRICKEWNWEKFLQIWKINDSFIPQKGGIVNLKHRTDRKASMLTNWNNHGKSLEPYFWFDACEPTNNIPSRTAACRLSHVQLLEKLLLESDSDDDWLLVLEDDAHWVDGGSWPEEPPPGDTAIAYFGCAIHQWFEDKSNKSNWQKVSAWYGHAYAVQRRFLPRVLQIVHEAPADWSIDMIYCHTVSHELRTLAWVPCILTQAMGKSDIEDAIIDRSPKIISIENISSPIHNFHHLPMVTPLQNLINNEWTLLTPADVNPSRWNSVKLIPADWDIIVFTANPTSKNWHSVQQYQNTSDVYAIAINGNIINQWSISGILEQIPIDWKPWLEQNSTSMKIYTSGEYQLPPRIIPDNLPTVTLVTPTFGRRNWFWNALYCFLRQDYPRDKLEWIILDEGDSPIGNWVPPQDSRIRYYYLTNDDRKLIYNGMIQKLSSRVYTPISINKNLPFCKTQKNIVKQGAQLDLVSSPNVVHRGGDFWKNRLPIGFKRNWLAAQAHNDIIIHWDDDDWYPINSVKCRVEALLETGKEIATCTTIPCFDVLRCISWMNVPPQKDPLCMRISEATMVYWKRAWEKQQFDSQAIGEEGCGFIKGRENDVYELPWENIIVSLVHSGNLSTRRSPDLREPNGWHFGGMNDDEFTMLVSLDELNFFKNIGLRSHIQRLIDRFL